MKFPSDFTFEFCEKLQLVWNYIQLNLSHTSDNYQLDWNSTRFVFIALNELIFESS